jgi:AmmeMemoRadiSam system protein A
MAPTASSEPTGPLAPALRQALLAVARRSIEHGLDHGRPLDVAPTDYGPELRATRASFVTLQIRGMLRGCIGHLEAARPLVVDVAGNAFAAAFRDPRFTPLRREEWPEVELQVSILSAPKPIRFADEAELLAQLRPGEDGLILQEGRHRGTFLPSVWDSLPAPREFLSHLKQKAGLPADHWSDRIEVFRYRTESFGDENPAAA